MNAVENRRLLLGGVLPCLAGIFLVKVSARFSPQPKVKSFCQQTPGKDPASKVRWRTLSVARNPPRPSARYVSIELELEVEQEEEQPCGQNFDGVLRQNLRKLCLHLGAFVSGIREFTLCLICLWNKIFQQPATTQSQSQATIYA